MIELALGLPCPAPKRPCVVMTKTTVVEEFYESGALRSRVEMVNGIHHGIEQVWHLQGHLLLRANYRRGVLHGTYETWWNNGEPRESGHFEQGQRVGGYYLFKPNGKLLTVRQFPQRASHSQCPATKPSPSIQTFKHRPLGDAQEPRKLRVK